MHIGIITYGSRGDVQPYVALALKLIQSGYKVTLAAPENFKSFVESYNVPFYAIYGNVEELIHSPECLEVIKSGNNLAFIKFMFSTLSVNRDKVFTDIYRFCNSVDGVITNNIGSTTVSVAVEHLHKKMIIFQLNPPIIETREFPVPGMPFLNFTLLNKLSYRLFYKILWHYAKRDVLEFRRMIDLPPTGISVFETISKNKIPVLHAFSSQLIKRPSDWEQHHLITGFLSLDHNRYLQNHNDANTMRLDKWLADGDKPIYIGFGSIPVPDPLKLRQIIAHTLSTTGERIVLCSGWSKIPSLSNHPNLFVIPAVNHQWLFPKCKVVVIHGGIGTLSTALKAGVPAVVVSLFVDQPVWGSIIAKKEVGLHLPWSKFTKRSFKKAIKKISSSAEIAENVKELSTKLNMEDGASKAVEHIKDYFN